MGTQRVSKRRAREQWIAVSNSPNPYLVIVLAATLAAFFSVVGGYYAATVSARQAIAQKQFELRAAAYTVFIEHISPSKAPAISQLFNIGSMAGHLSTDEEIQIFEDQVVGLLRKFDAMDRYWQTNAALNLLRVHGTPRVHEICDDILKSLQFRTDEVDWRKYPPHVRVLHDELQFSKTNGSYGWIERIDPEEWLMVIIISKLGELLVSQLWEEVHQYKHVAKSHLQMIATTPE